MSHEKTAYILIVDDDEDTAEMLQKGLSAMGNYRITTVHSGKEALELIQEESPDLILLDIMMKGMSGTEVCKTLKADEKTAHIPVIAITVIHKVDRIRSQEIIDSGVDEYLEKPFTFQKLRSIVEDNLNK